MALTITTIENLTVVSGTGGGATDVFVPSGSEVGRYRIRVVRWVSVGGAIGNTCELTGITTDAAGAAETQSLWLSKSTTATFTDSTAFPDECEFRGRIQANVTAAAGSLLFLYHG